MPQKKSETLMNVKSYVNSLFSSKKYIADLKQEMINIALNQQKQARLTLINAKKLRDRTKRYAKKQGNVDIELVGTTDVDKHVNSLFSNKTYIAELKQEMIKLASKHQKKARLTNVSAKKLQDRSKRYARIQKKDDEKRAQRALKKAEAEKQDIDLSETNIFDLTETSYDNLEKVLTTLYVYYVIDPQDEKMLNRTTVIEKDGVSYGFRLYPLRNVTLLKSHYDLILSTIAPQNDHGITNFYNGPKMWEITGAVIALNSEIRRKYPPAVISYFAGFSVGQNVVEDKVINKLMKKRDGFDALGWDDVLGDEMDEKVGDDNDKKINNKFIEYIMNTDGKTIEEAIKENHCDYVKNNFHRDSCMLTAIIDRFHDYMFERKTDKTRKKYSTELTFSNLCNILGIQYNPQGGMKISVKQTLPFFDKYKFSLFVFNIDMDLIYSHIPEKANTVSMYIVKKDKHVYLLNHNLTSLRIKKNARDCAEELKRVQERRLTENFDSFLMNQYYIPTDKDLQAFENTPSFYCDSVEKIVEIMNAGAKYEGKNNTKPKSQEEEYWEEVLTGSEDEGEDDAKDKPKEQKKDKSKVKTIIIYYDDLFELADFFISKKIYPVIFGDKHSVSKIMIKNVKNVKFVFKKTVDANDSICPHVTKENFKDFIRISHGFAEKMLRREFISDYVKETLDVMNAYNIGPTVCRTQENCNVVVDGLDVNSCYPHILTDHVKRVPVFRYYNVFEKYTGEEIDDYNYYIVKTNNLTLEELVLLPYLYSRCYGLILKHLDKSKYEILYVQHYDHLVETSYKKDFTEMYAVCDKEKFKFGKFIGCMTIGKYGIKHRPCENMSEYFETKKDAIIHSLLHNSDVIPAGNMYVCTSKKEGARLSNGFLQIHELVYTYSNLRIYQSLMEMKKHKIDVYGVRCDAIYFSNRDTEKVKAIFKISEKAGENKIELNRKVAGDMLKRGFNIEPEIANFDEPSTKLTLRNEDQYKTSDDYYDNFAYFHLREHDRVLLTSVIPGSGKSYICKKLCDNYKVLFCCFTNALKNAIIQQGFDCVTIHELLNLDFNGNVNKTPKNYTEMLRKYDYIVVDEVFQIHPRFLYQLRGLMQIRDYQGLQTRFIATGDVFQSPPVEFNNNKIMNRIVNMLFPANVDLKICKRSDLSDEKKTTLMNLKNELMTKPTGKQMEILKKYGPTLGMTFIDENYDNVADMCLGFYNYSCDVASEVIRKRKGLEHFAVGNVMTVCETFVPSSKHERIYRHSTWKIREIECEYFRIKNTDTGEKIKLDNSFKKYFQLSFAHTIDSIQGVTINKKFTILNVGCPFLTNKHLWTMITRATDYSNISVMVHSRDTINKYNNNYLNVHWSTKINGYLRQDHIAGRKISQNYIDNSWVINQFKAQNSQCYYCAKTMSVINLHDLTVDRIHNQYDHHTNNCVLSCLRCNVTKR